MKIGLYFGTFNPIHVGHLIIANHFVEHTDLEQVWLVVTPHNPMKQKQTLLNDYERLHLVQLAIEDYPKLKASDIEFKLKQPNYTVHTLAYFQELFPQHSFSLIMGEDNLNSFNKWKNYETILSNHEIYVYPRLGTKPENELIKQHSTIHFIDAPVVEISSTYIRENYKQNRNIKPLLPIKVWEYIDKFNLYH